MSSQFYKPTIEVNIEPFDYEIIDAHLRNSTVVLQDILKDSEDGDYGEEVVTADGGDSNNDGHMCQHCGKIYKNSSTLHAHDLLMHPKNEIEGKCVTCDKKYPSLMSLKKHIRYMHRFNHRCDACYRTFASVELLVVHGERCSKTETPCMHCGKVFDSQLAMRNHIKYKHPEKKNHWCYLCRRTFTTHRRLLNHYATIHPPGATDCTKCDKSFNSVTALQSHVLYKHTEDTHRCSQCNKGFAKETSLQKHFKKNHLSTENVKTEAGSTSYTNENEEENDNYDVHN